MKFHTTRTQRVAAQLDALPLAPAAITGAFEQFRDHGDVPEDQRLAEAVVDRASRGGAEEDEEMRQFAPILRVMAQMRREGTLVLPPGPPPPPYVRLLREAVDEQPTLAAAARLALKMLRWKGHDLVGSDPLDGLMIPDVDPAGPHAIAMLLRADVQVLLERTRAGDAVLATAFDRAANATPGRRTRALTALQRTLLVRGGTRTRTRAKARENHAHS